MRYRKILLLLVCMAPLAVHSQTQHQNTGWFFFLNNTRLSEKWGVHLDVQVRSQDEWSGVRSVLIRPGLQYFFNKNHNLTVGYLYTPTFTQMDGVENTTQTEHRAWEQYIFTHPVKTVNLSHRARLEQRFIGGVNGADDIFAQRFRYFFRGIIPFEKPEGQFAEGFFGAVQNEIFLNIQNKDQLNGAVFDQNRAYLAVGYRFSKAFDLEAGYMNQAVNGRSANTVNNIIQLALYTRF